MDGEDAYGFGLFLEHFRFAEKRDFPEEAFPAALRVKGAAELFPGRGGEVERRGEALRFEGGLHSGRIGRRAVGKERSRPGILSAVHGPAHGAEYFRCRLVLPEGLLGGHLNRDAVLPEYFREQRYLGPEADEHGDVRGRQRACQGFVRVRGVEQGVRRGTDEAAYFFCYPERFSALAGGLEEIQAGFERPRGLEEAGSGMRQHGLSGHGQYFLAGAEASVQRLHGKGRPYAFEHAAYVVRGAAEAVNGLVGIADAEKARAVCREHGLQDAHLQGREVLDFVHEHVLRAERSVRPGRMGCQPGEHVREVVITAFPAAAHFAVAIQHAAQEFRIGNGVLFAEIMDAAQGFARFGCGKPRLNGPGGAAQHFVLPCLGQKHGRRITFLNEPPGQGVERGAGRKRGAFFQGRAEAFAYLSGRARAEREYGNIRRPGTLCEQPFHALREQPGLA